MAIVRLPKAPAIIEGVINVRGELVPVLLDAGWVLLTQHEQNYPNINPNTGPFKVVTSNLNEPGPPGSSVALSLEKQ
jgi:chemotaxis signal transduction protein